MKRLILLVFALGLFSPVYAQEKSLLYEISGKGLTQPSFLYGTFHLICPADLQITDGMRKAMTNSKQLYLELDFDDPTVKMSMMTAMLLTNGKTIKDYLKPEDYTALDTFLQRNSGIGLSLLGTMKPIAIESMIYVALLKCEPASYDLKFAELAGQQGKEVLGLETVEQQMAVLDKIPIEQQLKDLVEVVHKSDEAQKEFSSLIAAYKAQDLTLLMKLVHDSKFESDSDDFSDELLTKRNNTWIPIIERASHEKPTFFAFGAAHLGGPGGVVSLLREKGYTVKSIP